MAILTKESLLKIEEYYYWSGQKSWVPFPEELKQKLLDEYGEIPYPYEWTEQDIHRGVRKIIQNYFAKNR